MRLRTGDDSAYLAAQCPTGHSDGTGCLPSWDGFGYICTHLILNDSSKEYTLMSQPGHYSDRLRSQFPPDDEAWNPPRDGDDDKPAKAQPLPKGVEGIPLGGRGKNKR